VTLRKALQGSLNIPAVKVLYLAGLGSVLDFADRLGYTTLKDRSRFGLSLVLGGGEVTPLEHAHAFSAFANDGTQFPIAPILKVEAPDGSVLSEWKASEGTRVVEQQTARLLSDVLTDNNARTYIFGAKNSLTLPDRPVATKTGTTNSYYDAWTIGYTPNLVTAVWVGNTKFTPMKQGADGSVVAAPIWQAYMKEATKDLAKESFQKPEAATDRNPALRGQTITRQIKVDKSTGLLATESTPPEQVDIRTYLVPHDILYFVDKDDPMGDAPTNPANDPQFGAWEAGVQAWIARTNATTTSQIPTASSDQYGPAYTPSVTVNEPVANTYITSRFVPVDINTSSPRNAPLTIHLQLGANDLGMVKGPPWNFGITIPEGLPDGPYNLTFTVQDDAGNRSAQSVPVILNLSGTVVDPYILLPTSTTSF
jgi:membrane peptidoglycan carboxypeptidase